MKVYSPNQFNPKKIGQLFIKPTDLTFIISTLILK